MLPCDRLLAIRRLPADRSALTSGKGATVLQPFRMHRHRMRFLNLTDVFLRGPLTQLAVPVAEPVLRHAPSRAKTGIQESILPDQAKAVAGRPPPPCRVSGRWLPCGSPLSESA